MNPVLVLLVASLALTAIGVVAMLAARRAPEAPPADAPERVRAAWLEIAIELCRIDGSISDTEIAAIEQALVQGGLAPDQARRAVSEALRREIGASRLGEHLREIARLAEPGRRAECLAALGEVAASDGEVSRDERALLERAREVLGGR